MGEGPDSATVLRDISLLYELSLSIGGSLELVPCCDAFLRTLMARKALDFAAVWVRGDHVRPRQQAQDLHLVYSNPRFRIREERVSSRHILSFAASNKKTLSVPASDPRFQEFVTEREVTDGCYAIFPLREFGLLKLYASNHERAFGTRELNQLRNVVDKFAVALEGCLTHEHLRWEVQERQRARRQLEASEERYRALYADNPAMYFTLDEEGRIISVNAFGASQLGFSVDELLGQPALGLIHERDRPTADEELSRSRDSPGQVFRWSVRRLHKDGSAIWSEDLARSIRGSGGTLRTLIVCQDVSERKLLEQQVQHSQKLESLGVLAGGVAHDFNNLLTGILGNAGIARVELPEAHETQECLAGIERAAQHAAELCDHLLAYAGKGQLLVGALSLDDVLDEMRPLLAVSISKKVGLEYSLAGELPPVEGDATQIRQIVINLVTNSSDAIGDASGSILITTGRDDFRREYFDQHCLGEPPPAGEYVYVEVRDTGSGMDEAMRGRIFDPFFTTKFTGRGLGLAAVEGIVRSHRGAVAIRSAPGAGTTIRVLFPRSKCEITQPLAPPPVIEVRHGEGRVLVVDDEADVRRVLTSVLERSGFEVVTATDGREGVDLFTEADGNFDLILLDLTMPNLDGVEALRIIHSIRKKTPVLLCSGFSGEGLSERLRGLSVAGFLKKPFQAADVIDKVCAILESARSR